MSKLQRQLRATKLRHPAIREIAIPAIKGDWLATGSPPRELREHRVMKDDSGARIVIAGTRRDWPGGTRTLTPRDPCREPNGTHWFGADVDPDAKQLWFRVASEDVRRIRAETPRTRGDRVIDALLAWLSPERRLQGAYNRFEVRVSDHGDAWIDRLRW